jgi:hypothetical protein
MERGIHAEGREFLLNGNDIAFVSLPQKKNSNVQILFPYPG